MKCSKSELIKTCELFLKRFDDYEQTSCELVRSDLSQYFTNSFCQLEILYRHIKDSAANVSYDLRNSIRILIKETEKMAIALTNF